MNVADLSDRESGVFGPGTDLVVSLAAVLMLLLAMKSLIHRDDLAELRDIKFQVKQNDILIKKVRDNQEQFVDRMAEAFGRKAKEIGKGKHVYGLDIDHTPEADIVFYGEAHRQRITFGGHLLFKPDEIELNRTGGIILTNLNRSLEGQEGLIREIHIEGHADTSRTEIHKTNLNLAALRAMTVFSELVRLGIDPYQTIMSATSYGEYLSVNRFRSDESYSKAMVERDNLGGGQKERNRRIEVLLVYRLESAEETEAASPRPLFNSSQVNG